MRIHGHVHDSFDYEAESTRVVASSRGYITSKKRGTPENKAFDPALVVRVWHGAPSERRVGIRVPNG